MTQPASLISASHGILAGESLAKYRQKPAAESGEYEIRLVATAKMEGRKDDRDYTIPDKKLRLKILKGSISK